MTINRTMRQNKILEVIVDAHIRSALPISSRYISEVLGLSSATIRNVMFELEKEGFIRQPHTSAGRIPTDYGYRRYVDNAMRLKEFDDSDVFERAKQYVTEKSIAEDIIESASHIVSEITNYTGLALSPNNRLYFDGTYHMLEHPEFNELGLIKEFLKIVEEKNELVNIMNKDMEEAGTRIRIGRENTFKSLKECTIITSTYCLGNSVCGNIGIIGPMRMNYERVIPIVESLARMTTEILEEAING
ncbi:MAG: hypothetical protein ABIH57_01925 [Candidatus Omnitrophota bacterium]